jgi:hypothetical protein
MYQLNRDSRPEGMLRCVSFLLLACLAPLLHADSITSLLFTVAQAAVGPVNVSKGTQGVPLCSHSAAETAVCSADGANAKVKLTNGDGGFTQATAGTNSLIGAVANGVYLFTILGPTATEIPLIIKGSTETSDNGSSSVGATQVAIDSVDDGTLGVTSFAETFSSSYGCTQSLKFLANVPCTELQGDFALHTTVLAETYSELAAGVTTIDGLSFTAAALGGNDASALIDPIVEIDPNFPGANQFQLIASPGVLSTPEPNLTVMVAFAFFVGIVCKRKKQFRTVTWLNGQG